MSEDRLSTQDVFSVFGPQLSANLKLVSALNLLLDGRTSEAKVRVQEATDQIDLAIAALGTIVADRNSE